MTREIKRLAAVMTVVTSAAFFSTLTSASPASANTDSCGSTHWPTLGESPTTVALGCRVGEVTPSWGLQLSSSFSTPVHHVTGTTRRTRKRPEYRCMRNYMPICAGLAGGRADVLCRRSECAPGCSHAHPVVRTTTPSAKRVITAARASCEALTAL